MTWVCAASTIFGYGALYSDIQVTFSDGRTKDLIQKAFPLTNSIAAGFAGSVKIGFDMIESLSSFLRLPPGEEKRAGWDPLWVAEHWSPIAKEVFNQAPPAERALKSKVLVVAVSPNVNSGFGAKTYFLRFSEPDFIPGIMCRPIQLCSIGSGAGIPVYKQSLKPLFKLPNNILKAEEGQPGGWARQIGFSISRVLADHPHPGISRHVHVVIVRRREVWVETNDENIYPPGEPRIEIRMPPIAHTYPEFQSMATTAGCDATSALC